MTNCKPPGPSVFISAGELVETGQPYMVQCTQFACEAVLTKAGRWNRLSTGEALPDVIDVYAPH